MQKKAKSKLTEFLFVAICLIGAAASTWKFTQILNESLEKKEAPIANITFRWKVAQRKFMDDLLWDRLQQMSPVYNGDTIRTAPAAEATIYFQDGNIIELTENSMIQIFIKGDVSTELKKGSANIHAVNGDFSLVSGDATILINQGAQIKTEADENGSLKMQVIDGKIVIRNQNGTFTVLSGETAYLSTDGIVEQGHLNVVEPVINAQILNFTENNLLVDFAWETTSKEILLELSDSKYFENIISSQKIAGAKKAAVPLPNGTTYWRISTVSDDENQTVESVSSKTKVIYSPAPTLLAPNNDYQVSYRTKLPSVRFSWTETERASSYQIDIADNPDMLNPVITKRTPQTSFTTSSLEEGTWYWRITPYYMINNKGLALPSQTNSFVINKSNMLEKPVLNLPGENALVTTKIPLTNGSVNYKQIYFSWKNDPEAVSYNFKLWKKEFALNKYEFKNITQNFYSINTQTYDIQNGDWIWTVEKIDSEGNKVVSEERPFYAIDADVEQKTLFPPDGYTVSDTRTQDLRFNWKTNITAETLVQIAKDSTFKNIVYSEKASGSSMSGRNLSQGLYFWRITAKLGTMEFSTTPKSFTVEPPMPAPVPVSPVPDGNVVVRPTKPYEFKWPVVPGADYYEIKIARASNPARIITDKNFIESKDGVTASVKINLDNYSEGSYVMTLQAFKEETMLSSRASGYIGTYAFNLKMLKPVQLLGPEDNITVDGATAIRNPPSMSWTIVDTPAKIEMVIYKIDENDKKFKRNDFSFDELEPFMVVANPASPHKMPPLREGNYFWKIAARTTDGFDISSLETRAIKVTSIPKLESPSMSEPKKNQVFDKEYFKTNKSISFKWGKVRNADQYIFRIRNSKKEVVFEKTTGRNTTELVITSKDFATLPKGKISWEVEAQSLYNGVLFQEGKVTPLAFKIDLPELQSPKFEQTGLMYGK